MNIKPYKSKYHKYILIFHYDARAVAQVKEIQSRLGWQAISYFADGRVKGWAFSSLDAVLPEILKAFPVDIDDDVLKDMENATERKFERPEGIGNEELSDNLFVPTTKPLYPFQIQAVDFILKVGGKALLAMDMGTGKTATAIGYGAYKRCGRVLVICPASVKENWKREIKSFAGIDAKIIGGGDEGGWEIINYDQLQKHLVYLKKQFYDLIICDESHYIKNKKAIRTKTAFKLLDKAKDVLFLTGTPIMNRPIEIYTTFNFIAPINFFEFATRYCGAVKNHWGWDFNGASHLDELKERMYWMHRRRKEDVLPQLPDKTVSVLNTEMKSWKEYKQVLEDFRQWLLDKDLGTAALYAEALTKANYLKQIVVRNKNIKEIIDDFLENGKKIIVFSQYKGVINELYEQYEAMSVRLTGDTPTEDRQGLVDIFQNDSKVRIFFSTIQAGGVGITLTEADTVLFTDMLWTPSNHHQAEDRAHRIGQKNNVNVYYLITPDTLEEKIWKMLRRKELMVNQIIEGAEKVRKVHIKSLLKNL
ncbi:MAG TPA: DEAD/DEAH box helicase [Patescibacteria group bacterium]|nr:DEAD/DEAH box helicase [Patescibacteria group bacterium]